MHVNEALTKYEAGELLARSGVAYQRAIDLPMIESWHEALYGITYEEARAALGEHIRTSSYFPTVADIVRLAGPARRSREATAARIEDETRRFEERWQYIQVLAPDPALDRAHAWNAWFSDASDWWRGMLARASVRHFNDGLRLSAEGGFSLRP